MNIQELNDCSIVDIETTGLSPDKDDIIEIGALRVRNNLVVAEFTQLIKSSKPLSKTVSQITGITDDMLADAKELDDTLSDFLRFVDNDTVVGHNIAFDANFISKKCVAYGLDFKNDTYDTLAVCKQEYPDVSHKLEDMIIQLGIKDSGIHHRALADCYHTHSLMTALKNHSALVLEIKPPKQRVLNPITKGLQTLHGILIGITCDDILTQEELLGLEEWMINNEQLAGNYPYDIINNAIWKVIEDGIIEQSELDYLLEFFKTQIDPLNAEIGAVDVELNSKSICLTGDFDYGSKQEVQERLTEMGATIVSSVTRKTDILLIGERGSDSWACGTYGTKAKKAIELRSKGYPIMILKEKDVQL